MLSMRYAATWLVIETADDHSLLWLVRQVITWRILSKTLAVIVGPSISIDDDYWPHVMLLCVSDKSCIYIEYLHHLYKFSYLLTYLEFYGLYRQWHYSDANADTLSPQIFVTYRHRRSQDFLWGCNFSSSKQLMTFFSCCPQNTAKTTKLTTPTVQISPISLKWTLALHGVHLQLSPVNLPPSQFFSPPCWLRLCIPIHHHLQLVYVICATKNPHVGSGGADLNFRKGV